MANWVHTDRYSFDLDAVVFVGRPPGSDGQPKFGDQIVCQLSSGQHVLLSEEIATRVLEAIGRTTEFKQPGGVPKP